MNTPQQRAAAIAYQIPGWMWPSELGWLWENFAGARRHLEIGIYCGKSLWMTAAAMGEGSVLGVDRAGTSAAGAEWERSVLDATVELVRQQTKVGFELWDMGLVEAARRAQAEGRRFDSAFLDADHHYAETLAAIECWLPLMRPGSLMAGHDYWTRDEGVMRAVQESFPERFQVAPDTRIWFARV